MLVCAAAALYPNLLISTTDPALNITVYNARSGDYALTVGLIWWCFGIALAITHEDAEGLGEAAETALAADAVRKLERVIDEMKEARDPRALLAAAGWAAGATVIWLAVLWLLGRTMHGAARRIYRYAERKSAEMRAAGPPVNAR